MKATKKPPRNFAQSANPYAIDLTKVRPSAPVLEDIYAAAEKLYHAIKHLKESRKPLSDLERLCGWPCDDLERFVKIILGYKSFNDFYYTPRLTENLRHHVDLRVKNLVRKNAHTAAKAPQTASGRDILSFKPGMAA